MARREDVLKHLAQEINDSGGRAAISAGDVSVAQDVQRAVDAAFNNAGFAGDDLSPLHELDQALFDRTMAVNVSGTWNCLRSQISVMLEAGKGAIVNTSSTAAMGATGAPVPYVAAKHAVLGMTRAAAAEYAAHGIRINTLVVGTTRTDMINQVVEAYPELGTAFVARRCRNAWQIPSRSPRRPCGCAATAPRSPRGRPWPWTAGGQPADGCCRRWRRWENSPCAGSTSEGEAALGPVSLPSPGRLVVR